HDEALKREVLLQVFQHLRIIIHAEHAGIAVAHRNLPSSGSVDLPLTRHSCLDTTSCQWNSKNGARVPELGGEQVNAREICDWARALDRGLPEARLPRD